MILIVSRIKISSKNKYQNASETSKFPNFSGGACPLWAHGIYICSQYAIKHISPPLLLPLLRPCGGSKNVKGHPYFSIKLVPGGPYFSKNMDRGVQICHDRPPPPRYHIASDMVPHISRYTRPLTRSHITSDMDPRSDIYEPPSRVCAPLSVVYKL